MAKQKERMSALFFFSVFRHRVGDDIPERFSGLSLVKNKRAFLPACRFDYSPLNLLNSSQHEESINACMVSASKVTPRFSRKSFAY